MSETIAERFLRVQESVLHYANQRDWQRGNTKLIVVTKKQNIEACIEAEEAGARFFGENYAEEAVEKFKDVSFSNMQFHMIGHLQSRKVKLLAPLFSVVQTIDRFEIAEKLDRYYEGIAKKIDALVEIDLSGELTKSGFSLSNDADVADFYKIIEKMIGFKNINLVGLMTMGHYPQNEETNRAIFSLARRHLETVQSKLELASFNELSMGTSRDYVTAIQEGATMVRVGELIMGPRSY